MGAGDEGAYDSLLETCRHSMVYHTSRYRQFLKAFLPSQARDHYLLAYQGGALVAALPTFVLDGPEGPALNSLPFFGSHGSIVATDASSSAPAALVEGMRELCANLGVAFATVIDTPFQSNEILLREKMEFHYTDDRIGQVTPLPSARNMSLADEKLMELYHQKTRNVVRKALRGPFSFGHDASSKTLDDLHRLHEVSLSGKGGVTKPRRFFSEITQHFRCNDDYRVYSARNDEGEVVCALLLLYDKDTVEYCVPASDPAWRALQPLSALIHISMRDAVVERGARRWNWGGTWRSQAGVYNFKSRWGTEDFPYRYYTRVSLGAGRVEGLSTRRLLAAYPWFYTIPFQVLT
jgi:hypothetical protein